MALTIGDRGYPIYHHLTQAALSSSAQEVAEDAAFVPTPPMPEAAHQAGEHGRRKTFVFTNSLELPVHVEVLQSSGHDI